MEFARRAGSVEGRIFDRRPARLSSSRVRLRPKCSGPRLLLRYSEIAASPSPTVTPPAQKLGSLNEENIGKRSAREEC
jgi:hypothetical protein